MKGLLVWIVVYLGVLNILDQAFLLEGLLEWLFCVIFSWTLATVAQEVVSN
jgi:hypothetical protein